VRGTNVLVTGADGFVGSRLVSRLATAGARVRTLVRSGFAGPHGQPGGQLRIRGDVTDRQSVERSTLGAEIVFHCAWGGSTLAEARWINVEGTRNLVEAAASAGARRVVHLSTMAVHGDSLPSLLTEDCPFDLGGDAYGVSKAEGELAAFEVGAASGVEVVALRPTLVYGPRAPFWLMGYLERCRTEQLALIDGGRGLANLIHVDDLVDAMLLSAVRPGVAGEAFLISGPEPVSWREYIGHFARMCGKPIPPSVPLLRARIEVQCSRVYSALTQRRRRLQGMDLKLMAQRTVVSIEKARRLLAWEPRLYLTEGMAVCERWLREQGYLARAPGVPGRAVEATVRRLVAR